MILFVISGINLGWPLATPRCFLGSHSLNRPLIPSFSFSDYVGKFGILKVGSLFVNVFKLLAVNCIFCLVNSLFKFIQI